MPRPQFTLRALLVTVTGAACISALGAMLPAEAWLSIAAWGLVIVGVVLGWESLS